MICAPPPHFLMLPVFLLCSVGKYLEKILMLKHCVLLILALYVTSYNRVRTVRGNQGKFEDVKKSQGKSGRIRGNQGKSGNVAIV